MVVGPFDVVVVTPLAPRSLDRMRRGNMGLGDTKPL
ncbi:hypothetical protein FHR36_006365 [Kitasatospora paracochleata]|uniref:Uncharacterized protein n=1 Tax=Kitasatospora paracochleata TaxID=58354 RepID=A0ABT1J7R2_9ACTN|nr:hypothetical protein [Kitasatospora paracochleata]